MRILVCVKRVPMTGGKIVLTEDAQAIETKHLGFTISPHEECGVEEAVRLSKRTAARRWSSRSGRPRPRSSSATRWRSGPTARSICSPTATSGIHRRRPRRSSRRSGPTRRPAVRFDLVIFGNESADSGGFQVGIRVAYALGRPVATGLKGVAVEGETVRCEQEVAGGRDVFVLPLPAVVTVLEGLNLPRYPSVPAKLSAQRKPVERELTRTARSETREAPARRAREPGQAGRDPWPRDGGGARRRRGVAQDRRRVTVLVYIDEPGELAQQALAFARSLGEPVHGACVGEAVPISGVETLHVAQGDGVLELCARGDRSRARRARG